MSARRRIRKADTDKSIVNKKTEKADSERLENRAFREAENCIIEITKKIRKWNVDKSVKNEFFIRKIQIMSKKNS